ncbi:MAG: CotH kinase family protein [Ruminiclostridium sp.]|nr:CotH kinase family protein [Ruminiclostridium sp.]
MRKILIRRAVLTAAALALSLGMTISASAAGNGLDELTWQASPDHETTVSIQQKNGTNYLFLPAFADLTALTLSFQGDAVTVAGDAASAEVTSGQPFDLTALFAQVPADGRWTVTLTQGEQSLELTVMQSASIGSVYLTSADPEKDRAWVELDKDKNKAKGEILYLRADGSTVYAGELKQIKGRGNSTWAYPKKPYQIKLDEKFDLLEAGEASESTWILLANYCDPTLIHNTVTFDLAQKVGLAYTPNSAPVDLYYDGEYRGSYLLCEKTEVGEGRVDIHDLEGDIEDANPQVEDLDDCATARGTTAAGKPCQYVTGLTAPKDISGGYLLEMDFQARAMEEKSWFATTAGCYLVSKSPEYLPQEAMAYISGLYQAFEDAVMNGGTHPVTGKDYTEYVDLDSLVKCFLMLELSQDGDAFQSSTYFYKPAGEGKLYAGPLWDFDSAYGTYYLNYSASDVVAGASILGKGLLSIPSFREALETYMADFGPEMASARDVAAQQGALLSASQAMDHILWPDTTPGSYPRAIEDLQTFLEQRGAWLSQRVEDWTAGLSPADYLADVKPADWFAPNVNYVLEHGLMNGVSKTHFAPNATLTRAMAVTVLYRIAGEPAPTAPAAFSDVPAGQWYSDAVVWAAEKEIAQGFEGLFRPDDKVTRQELVALIHRYDQSLAPTIGDSYVDLRPVTGPDTILPPPSEIILPEDPELTPSFPDLLPPDWVQGTGTTYTYTDLDQIADWAVEDFAWAIEQGILTGNDDGTQDPQGSALRCQFAAMIQRYHQTIT